MKTIKILFFLLLISSCAQIVAPGGGARDKTSPKVLRYSPDSGQLNFHAKYIQLDFDEYIQLKDLNNQLIISPPFEKAPEIKVKNKSLTIDLSKETLLPNTTYSINFGNALQDNNENNPLENFKYIFSTGSYIDSLSIKGKVQTAFDHTSEKGVLVMLYSDTDDSAIYKKQPDYFGKTKQDGTFGINNIRPGKFKIYALKDANSDFKYSGDAESIGFVEGTVDPSEKKEILIETFTENPKKVFLKKYNQGSYGKIMLYMNTGADSIRVKNIGVISPENELIDYSRNRDTVTYWVKNYDKDSLKLQITNDTTIIDTVEFKMIKKEDALKARKNALKLSLMNNFNGNQAFDLNAGLQLVFNNPIASINKDNAILLNEDSIPVKNLELNTELLPATTVNIITWDSAKAFPDPKKPGTYTVTAIRSPFRNLKESTKYHLLILPGTFTDIFGLTNDSIKIDFKTREQKFYGTLRLKVATPEMKGKYIVQLMDEKENLIRQRSIDKTEIMDFEYLYPNKYKVKIIYDENGNGKWDSGNFLQHVQPEKTVYNMELITIRSNWDADIEWNLVEPVKKKDTGTDKE